ncbi:hypothetical protein C0992_013070 [Termitomyces sp. T32_za158]|nr:hypothetical protein C0992_013070 [Termitomyces sp. T32_za158]
MAIEDGAVLAKLFSHLRSADQITSFLYAFESLRLNRCTSVCTKEFGDMYFMTLPSGPEQEGRDNHFRGRRDRGLNVLDAESPAEETPQWTEIKEVFGYDAEDEADNWWQEWGLLRERAAGRMDVIGEELPSVVVKHQKRELVSKPEDWAEQISLRRRRPVDWKARVCSLVGCYSLRISFGAYANST